MEKYGILLHWLKSKPKRIKGNMLELFLWYFMLGKEEEGRREGKGGAHKGKRQRMVSVAKTATAGESAKDARRSCAIVFVFALERSGGGRFFVRLW